MTMLTFVYRSVPGIIVQFLENVCLENNKAAVQGCIYNIILVFLI